VVAFGAGPGEGAGYRFTVGLGLASDHLPFSLEGGYEQVFYEHVRADRGLFFVAVPAL
jgi:hypothetical protein